MKYAVFLGLLVLVGTVAYADEGVPIWELEAKAQVQASLRDGSSAQFIGLTRQNRTTCGSVNAKNGYNGYAGTIRFAIVGAPTSAAKSPFNGTREEEELVFATDPATAEMIIEICRGQY